jgi:hypothetical protein
MGNSLKDQLVGLGYTPPPAPEKPPRRDDAPRRDRDARPDARGPRPDSRGPRPDNRGARPDNRGARPDNRGARPDNRGARPDSRGPRPDARGPRPVPAPGAPGAPAGPRPDARPGAAPANRGPRRDGKPAAPGARAGGAPARKPGGGEMDLGKAFAMRAQAEKDARIAAEAQRQEEARQRREARAALGEFLKDKVLNDAAADIARHFPYGGKIKRIHVTPDQLAALNRGELGVLQQDGRYLLVDKATLDEAERIFAPALALRVDPDAPQGDDPYADPQFQVPDDLVW